MRIRNNFIDTIFWLFGFTGCLVGSNLIMPNHVFAFTKFKNGLEMITNNYLQPLSQAVAGCALIAFIIASYFQPVENLKKVFSIFMVAMLGAAGAQMLTVITQSFS